MQFQVVNSHSGVIGWDHGRLALDELETTDVVAMLDAHKVVAFRDCLLPPEKLLSIANRLGTPVLHALKGFHEPENPFIMLLSNLERDGKPIGIPDAGRTWHSDSAFSARPPAYTMLNAVHVPTEGGHTHFIDMQTAYLRLPQELKHLVDTHKGIFSYRQAYEQKRKANPNRRPLTPQEESTLSDVMHPLRLIHPNTGIAAIYLNETHIVGIHGLSPSASEAAVRAILEVCYKFGSDYVHRWRCGDLLIWDNRSVIHRATEYPADQKRHIRRVSIG
jgi:taurine dioxygenase